MQRLCSRCTKMHRGDAQVMAHSIVKLRVAERYYSAGNGCRTLVMALVGMSHPRQHADQVEKIQGMAHSAKQPHIISDLSIVAPGTELPLWKIVLRDSMAVAACLPVYTASTHNGLIDSAELLQIAIEQMEGGVGLLTIHPTPTKRIKQLSERRLTPCTSRGGGLIIADAERRGWREENAYLKIMPELIHHAKKNGVVLSLGAAFRSANIFDSCDEAQLAEIEYQIELAAYIHSNGVGVIIESPGHARPQDIRKLAGLLRPAGFPVMPLGPIPTDTAIGMDHVSSAIGATIMGLEGCAQILAAVTREEHTGGVPTLESTLEAVATAFVAAHVIDIHMIGDDGEDFAVAQTRAVNRTCVVDKNTRGCDRCVRACPL